MKKITKKQRLIITVSIIFIIILSIIFIVNIINKKNNISEAGYFATTENAGSNLIAGYIQKGVTIGGITGTQEVISKTEVEELVNQIVDSKIENEILNLYPVGSIYISTNDRNPSEFIGGSWESYGEGRTLVGAGTGTDENSESKTFIANTLGGEYNHTLSLQEIPAHTHRVSLSYTQNGLNNSWVQGNFAVNWSTYSGTTWNTGDVRGNGGSGQFGIANSEGGSKPHNNIQPYIVTYMWKRVE